MADLPAGGGLPGVFTNEAGPGQRLLCLSGGGPFPGGAGLLGDFPGVRGHHSHEYGDGVCIRAAAPRWRRAPALALYAYQAALGPWGGRVISLCTALFALATVTAWSCYGREGLFYLTGGQGGTVYALAAAAAAGLGCLLPVGAVFLLGTP